MLIACENSMKKIIYITLVLLSTLSLSAVANEKQSSGTNFFCDTFGIGCSIIRTTAGDGMGKEPPKRGE